MKSAATKAGAKSPQPVIVRVCDEDHKQPSEDFRLCPLGVQFYSTKPLNEFDLFEFNLDVDKKTGAKKKGVPLKCTGAVVRCTHEKEAHRYRVWVQFLDLPKSARDKICCASRNGKHLCSYCENF